MSSIEEHTAILGATRQGKTGYLADRILGAAGPVLAASSGGDLVRLTMHLRAQHGPVYVFNPSNIGQIKSTLAFGIYNLVGCEHPQTAIDLATDLLAGTPLANAQKDREWLERANEALSAFIHAAALGGGTMHHVQRWVADPDSAVEPVLNALRNSPEPAIGYQALQFFNLGRPRSSVCMTITPALRWLADPVAVECASGGALNVETLLAEKSTVYLLAEKDGPVAPLITALAGYVARNSRRIADRQSHERLEPGFKLILDEAPSICALPLPAWTADFGKRNISIDIVGQSLSQFADRWGDKGAGALLTNCSTVVVFGGTKDPQGLSTFTTLAGDLLKPWQFMQLPKLHAVVFRNGMLPVVGRPPMVWQRPDHKAAVSRAVWDSRLSRLGSLCRAPFRRALAARRPVRTPIAALPASQPRPEWDALLVTTTGRNNPHA